MTIPPVPTQISGFLSTDEVPVQSSPIDLVRRPDVLYTENYDNDPILFDVDDRLFHRSITLEVPGGVKQYRRDESLFLRVGINDSPSDNASPTLPVLMTTHIYNRKTFTQIINTTFSEF